MILIRRFTSVSLIIPFSKRIQSFTHHISADELVRKRCRDREEYYDDIRSYQHALAKQEQELKEKDIALQENRRELREKDIENARLRQKLIEAGINPED